MKNLVWKTLGGAALVLAFGAESSFGVIVYDNTVNRSTNSSGQFARFAQPGVEFGDQVILAGGALAGVRTVTSFSFEYYLTGAGSAVTPGGQARLRFYPNTGASGSPAASPLFTSVVFDVFNTDPNDAQGEVLTFSGLNVTVPDTFTWTVEFMNLGAGANAGLPLYSPPTVGNSFTDYWLRDGGGNWVLGQPNPPTTPTALDFSARIDAVPEPGTIALGALGLAFICAHGLKRRKS